VSKSGWYRAVGGVLADSRGDPDWRRNDIGSVGWGRWWRSIRCLWNWLGDSAWAIRDGESSRSSDGIRLGTMGEGGWTRANSSQNVRGDGGVGSGIIRPAVGHGEQRKGWEERLEGLHLDVVNDCGFL